MVLSILPRCPLMVVWQLTLATKLVPNTELAIAMLNAPTT
jgi:hypothetical protein